MTPRALKEIWRETEDIRLTKRRQEVPPAENKNEEQQKIAVAAAAAATAVSVAVIISCIMPLFALSSLSPFCFLLILSSARRRVAPHTRTHLRSPLSSLPLSWDEAGGIQPVLKSHFGCFSLAQCPLLPLPPTPLSQKYTPASLSSSPSLSLLTHPLPIIHKQKPIFPLSFLSSSLNPT